MQSNPVYVEAYVVGIDGKSVSPELSSASYVASAPTASAPLQNCAVNEAGAREFLSSSKWPAGLQDTLIRNLNKIPIRFFICDDSGSMCANDGHRLVGNDPRHIKSVSCSRWAELANSLTFHSNLAFHANAPTEFRLLNGAPPILIGDANDPGNADRLTTFHALLENSPGGGTPLCRHVREVVAKVREMEPQLRSRGQKACVVIMTDGESSDGNLSEAMAALKMLPVWCVVRLCTDEDNVVHYWNNIDNELELDMDVLDDLCGEAAEVCDVNPWLTYGEPLHRLREFGIPVKEIDLLDEAKLNLDQIRLFCALLLGGRADDYPHPDLGRSQFIHAIQQETHRLPLVWNPVTKHPTAWINTSKFPGAVCSGCIMC